jgi:hypothetical protein
MLWGLGQGTVVLFPRGLLDRLAPEARDTLLAHELAHYLRRDHWVRVLEFVATGLYWWHPAVWLARREIESAEEECCDAWVVGGLSASPRRYAEALLATVDYDAELRRPCLPPTACAAGRSVRLLHRRLLGIIDADRPRQLRGGRVLRAVLVAGLLVQPALRAASSDEPDDPATDAGIATLTGGSLSPDAATLPLPPKAVEPRSWASAAAPVGGTSVVARDREVLLYRADGSTVPLGPGRPLALSFAGDGARIATAGPGPLVRTWDDQGRLQAEARVGAAARAIAYTPDGTRLIVLDAAGTITVLDANSLEEIDSWYVVGPANSIACSPDGGTIAVSFGSWLAENGWVECWSISEKRRLATYSASAPVGACRFSPDGRTLVIGGWNGLVAWRSLPGGALLAERQLPKAAVASAAFSPEADTLPFVPPPEPAPPPVPVPRSEFDLTEGIGAPILP